jgi:predicted AlkP superfamily phosphohydrolase/phosphomutase
MIGLDAADLGFIQSFSNELPNLRGVLTRGALHTFRSTADRLTGSVWPTFYTSSNPGEHGIYHHLQWDAGSMRMRRVTPEWLDCEPFWHELSRRGFGVISVDVPLTFPAREVSQGLEILNWGSHDQLGDVSCRPRHREPQFRRFGSHPMGIEIPVGKSVSELEKIRNDLVRGAKKKGALLRWAIEQAPWDFFIGVFGETHRGGHILWPDGPDSDAIPANALLDVYRAVDAALGDLLTAPSLADAGLILFSIHGMGPNTSQEHFVPAVMDLVNAGFAGSAPDQPSKRGPRPPHGIVRALRERVPAAIQNRIARLVPVSVRDEVVNRSVVGGHDWARTSGFDLSADMNGYLRLNVRGREREGTLERDGDVLPLYVAWVRECFESLRIAGTGEPLVGAVHSTKELFPGPRVDHLPDLVVTWSGSRPTERIESPLIGAVSAKLATGRSGNHRRDGFCAVSVPGLEARPLTDGRDLAKLVRAVFE